MFCPSARFGALGSSLETDGMASFIGLRQLSLITDDIASRSCILRTDEYWTTFPGLRKVIHTRPELEALVSKEGP